MSNFKSLTKAEEQIMQALWKIGQGFTKDIIDQLPDPKPHYNTVSTILKILLEKDFVKVTAMGKSHLYKPTLKKDQYSRQSARHLVKGYFNGSFANMLSFFAKEKDITVKELEELPKEMKQNS